MDQAGSGLERTKNSISEARVLSPFITGTNLQYAWDSTSFGWLKECPRKYYYMQIEGWDSPIHALELQFGIWYGQALEHYDHYRISWAHEEALRMVVDEFMTKTWGWAGWDPPNTNRNRETLIRSIIWYLEEFRLDPFETYILENGKPAVELSFRFELPYGPQEGQPYLLCGHLDRVVNFSGGLYVTDRKTTKSTISSDWFSRFDLDNQMSLYTIAANVVFHAPVKGVVIDGAQIAVGFTRYARGLTYRTPAQTDEWLADTKLYLRQAEAYAKANYWPMNEKSCFLCIFKRVCSKDPAVRQTMLESDFVKRKWNPLAVR
jgi:hypothetical protein